MKETPQRNCDPAPSLLFLIILKISSKPVTFNFLKFFSFLKTMRHHKYSPLFQMLFSFPPIFPPVKEFLQKSVTVSFSILHLKTKQMLRLDLNSLLPQPPLKLRRNPFKVCPISANTGNAGISHSAVWKIVLLISGDSLGQKTPEKRLLLAKILISNIKALRYRKIA